MSENLNMKKNVSSVYLSFIFFGQQQNVFIILLPLGGFLQNTFGVFFSTVKNTELEGWSILWFVHLNQPMRYAST